ncbi:similar to Saccharomyces cerevisiae YKL028W TFA1 TFIIE large subunit, involved in recruitment of RNA polymerase II to the promoter, activation of TFIIH, and promoter opening [Maudiozyma barnettii]|uniref:Similar to Saccharomyces cerevisiae YKL028W TFA1 TFIIE large subunit, involved in recruitment of RNA polymerase II to the promoter, activation of TFIIH, and promoter opening n=1 Tax=Maudiozyma barnettii TaxID=61262 RepID=A0A8H2VJH3_9SACH|nr:transcription factor TFIIE subunit TFA1 [Kazachstania barnettii]CAB4256409.1 similar to Saccharomyces cerevisiae YKL028W TFA1 TFIIE large subunit, involved in recruitment of RNA polymerase II to the promoter, activation of TFIIH, and promoter opening [Kazachstania barnettii]CAD1785018.1 similar to Saccharomyces cerevisiae YKL028W TFA1 TFIIE large subunit, involved in recruitment of RNA polymerase II to the promoter, activation of TFIIH, and promoter opening [Kazachstania barnettii]
MDRPIDETVKSLLKFVVRGFYGGSYVLVIDAILFHSVLAEEDLKQLLSINKTELGPLIARLRSDRLISIHKQREYPPNNKSVERIYFYIKFPHAIDAIKWKVHQLVQRFKDDLDKNSAPNGYMCPICLTKYSQLEAVQLLNYDRTEFLCSLCDEPLIEDDSGKKNKEKQDKLNRLMDQIQPLIDYLKKIDDSRIEENTFEFALAKLIPPQNQSNAAYTYNPKKGSTMFRPGDAPLANVMGTALNNDSSRRAGANSQATLHINITTANDEIAQRQLQERQAEEKRKQNAVPEWHKQSTIGKSALGRLDAEDEFDPQTTQNATMSMNENSTINNNGASQMDGSLNNNNNNNNNDHNSNNANVGGYNNGYNNGNRRGLTESEMEERENERTLNDYYAQLAKKQAREEKKKQEEEDEDEEFEDVDEFEMDGDDDDDDKNGDDDNGEFEDVVQDVTQPSKVEETKKDSDDEDMDIDLEFEDV